MLVNKISQYAIIGKEKHYSFAQLDKKCLSLQTKYCIQDNGKHSKLDI